MPDRTDLPWVLLPGLLCDGAAWGSILLSRPKTPAFTPTYRASRTLGEIASAVLREAPETFLLVGHSMGGYVAFEMLRQAPKRCVGLLLISTQADADTPEQSAARRDLAGRARDEGLDDIAKFMAKLCIPKTADNAAALRQQFAAMAHRYGVDAFAAHQDAIAGRPSSLPDLPDISVPTLVVGTVDDKIVPSQRTFAMTDALPDAQDLRLDTGGHLPMWTRQQDCIKAVRLLSENLSSS
ncbi:MAG: alpha/beta hydrolase [Rhodospirillaceae bacterium]|nr:alpha/beta hydrolase [Rhodospirillaceae bacterium]